MKFLNLFFALALASLTLVHAAPIIDNLDVNDYAIRSDDKGIVVDGDDDYIDIEPKPLLR